MNNRIKAFVEAFNLVSKFNNATIADIRRIGIQYQVDDDLLVKAIVSGTSGFAADLLDVDLDELDKAIDESRKKSLN